MTLLTEIAAVIRRNIHGKALQDDLIAHLDRAYQDWAAANTPEVLVEPEPGWEAFGARADHERDRAFERDVIQAEDRFLRVTAE